MLEFLSYLANNLLDCLLVVGGFSALFLYGWQQRERKRTAATLLKSQIDSIEKNVMALKEDHQLGDVSVYYSKQIIGENLWDKYKHLFVKMLSQSEIDIIQKFFDNAEQVERSRKDILKTIITAWEHHSFVQHFYAINCISATKASEDELQIRCSNELLKYFKDWYKKRNLTYTPEIAIDALTQTLLNFTLLSGTTAYQKIQKNSFDK